MSSGRKIFQNKNPLVEGRKKLYGRVGGGDNCPSLGRGDPNSSGPGRDPYALKRGTDFLLPNFPTTLPPWKTVRRGTTKTRRARNARRTPRLTSDKSLTNTLGLRTKFCTLNWPPTLPAPYACGPGSICARLTLHTNVHGNKFGGGGGGCCCGKLRVRHGSPVLLLSVPARHSRARYQPAARDKGARIDFSTTPPRSGGDRSPPPPPRVRATTRAAAAAAAACREKPKRGRPGPDWGGGRRWSFIIVRGHPDVVASYQLTGYRVLCAQ